VPFFLPFIFTTLHERVSVLRLKIDHKVLRSTETKKNEITLLVQPTNKMLYLLSPSCFFSITKEIKKKNHTQKPQAKRL